MLYGVNYFQSEIDSIGKESVMYLVFYEDRLVNFIFPYPRISNTGCNSYYGDSVMNTIIIIAVAAVVIIVVIVILIICLKKKSKKNLKK